MNWTQETPQNTLTLIQRRVPGVSAHFEIQKGLIATQLQASIFNSHNASSIPVKTTGFGSAWLPGPLSYPWLLMFAGIPMIIEHLLRQV